ncbi:unnamed protein product [Arabidopsis arenosa]|uniref:non-specific serine/threonine protein kinase n=1 Tax=Arabidopsis arenosa TaxID=38785 RepID=A0A8S2AGD5_ARAAE|nr:unnamed protein product [Arabidopsis arenosa]
MEKKIKGSHETELHKNDLSIEDPSPRCVLEIPAMSSDSDNSSSSSCSSCSPDKSSVAIINNSYKQNEFDCDQILVAKPSWRNFTFDELVAATDNFNPENMIGKGGHAEVYKGVLPDGETVAIKKLTRHAKEVEERVSDFLSELGIIAHYSPHGSLASLLFGSEECLDWKKRYKVALGIADGLSYLHNDCPRRIIHRDIKASNILLSQDYEAQISDFGLAKWLPENWPHHIVFPIEGTFGYLAPEYFMHGIVDEKTDVFAFGVLLLEIITGRRAVDTASRQSIVMWAKPLLEKNSVDEIVDPQLINDFDETEMKRVMQTASMCIHHVSTMRPDMNRLVQLLRGDNQLAEQKPGGARTHEPHPKNLNLKSLAKAALTEADNVISISPDDAAGHIVRALALDLLGHHTSALKSFDMALTYPRLKSLSVGERADALVKRAEMKLAVNRRRRIDSAIEDLEEAVRLAAGTDAARLFRLLGECYEFKGLNEKAQWAFSEALKAQPSSANES